MPRKRTCGDGDGKPGGTQKRLKLEKKEQQPEKRSTLALLLSQAATQPQRRKEATETPPVLAQPVDAWTVKHAPRLPTDLVVHKRKVTDVRNWLCSVAGGAGQHSNSCLVISGPAGSGKSATVKALATELGYDIVEWQPPAPTSWAEHQYQVGSGVQYLSKLDEFEAFVSRSKFASLALAPSSPRGAAPAPSGGLNRKQAVQGSQEHSTQAQQATLGATWEGETPQKGPASPLRTPPPKLILVDDLPYAAGDARKRLERSLEELAVSSRGPVVVLLSSNNDNSQGPQAAATTINSRDMTAVLSNCCSATMSFNPITAANIGKALARIAEAEGLQEDPALVKAVAEQAAGDLRNAIETFQWLTTGKACKPKPFVPNGKGRSKKGGKGKARAPTDEEQAAACQSASVAARDISLNLFHVLGKVLYNKRLEGGGSGAVLASQSEETSGQHNNNGSSEGPQEQRPRPQGGNGLLQRSICQALGDKSQAPHPEIAPRLQRAPMKSDPEDILMRSGLGAATSIAFLHQNVLQFMPSIHELADGLDYLSLADCMLGGGRRGATQEAWEDSLPGRNATDALAALVGMRGLMFASTEPVPRSFTPLQAPLWRLVQKGIAANSDSLLRLLRTEQLREGYCSSATQYATTTLPFVRQMAAIAPRCGVAACLPERWSRLWNGKLTEEVRQGLAPQPEPRLADGVVEPESSGGNSYSDEIADSDFEEVMDLT